MNFLENITFRRRRTISEPNNDTSGISQTLDETTNSVPGMSEDEEDRQINILKNEIENLRSQLKSANQEIEILSLENSSLKQANADLIKKNETLKKVTSSPIKKKTQTPKRNKISSRDKKTSKSLTLEISDGCASTNEQTQKLLTTGKEIRRENANLIVSNATNKMSQDSCQNNLTPVSPSSLKRKMYMISSETSNRLYKFIESTHLHKIEICHYRMPKCGLKVLLDGIGKKVANFTNSDFCIIYIGEDDFRRTQNYIELVTHIREILMPLQHTNFIICLPTFKYMENTNVMFNSRVDIFNNLLYMDVETYNYAYVLDSNYNLPYTHNTYNSSGNLNYKGLRIVFSDLADLISYVSTLKTDQIGVDCLQRDQALCLSDTQTQEESQFFL